MPSLFRREVESAINARPFVPFNLVLSDGLRYLVRGPDEVVMQTGVVHHFPPSTDRHNVLRTSKLVAIELMGRP